RLAEVVDTAALREFAAGPYQENGGAGQTLARTLTADVYGDSTVGGTGGPLEYWATAAIAHHLATHTGPLTPTHLAGARTLARRIKDHIQDRFAPRPGLRSVEGEHQPGGKQEQAGQDGRSGGGALPGVVSDPVLDGFYGRARVLAAEGNRAWGGMTAVQRDVLVGQVAGVLRERGEGAARRVVVQLRMREDLRHQGYRTRSGAEREARELIALHHPAWPTLPAGRQGLELAEVAYTLVTRNRSAALRTVSRLAYDAQTPRDKARRNAQARRLEHRLRTRLGNAGFDSLLRRALDLLQQVAHLPLTLDRAGERWTPAQYQALLHTAHTLHTHDTAPSPAATTVMDQVRRIAVAHGLDLPAPHAGTHRRPATGTDKDNGEGTSSSSSGGVVTGDDLMLLETFTQDTDPVLLPGSTGRPARTPTQDDVTGPLPYRTDNISQPLPELDELLLGFDSEP
ncbi:hypothetical protein, partial [Streptomyces sp. NPDC056632]|uniref:hypothetical protein n=1 Tax=Streptomyces sp. NPDC056632 TaxID=3345884 RepID=UPI00369714B0